MTSPRRVLLAALGVVAVLGATSLPAGARALQDGTTTTAPGASTSRPEDGTAGTTAIDDLAACIQGSRRLAVVFLIDESGSLQTSDPDNLRVDAALAALDSLASLTDGPAAGRTQLDVTFAAFSNRYRVVRDWTTVSPATLPDLVGTVESYRKLNQGTDTDFVNALTGARAALADRSAALTAEGGQEPCKAMVLFTDGKYDIGVRTDADIDELGATKPYAPDIVLDSEANALAAEAAGRAALCRSDGLADGVRSDGVTVLTVALTGRVDPEAQKLLEAMSTGTDEVATCGTPRDRAAGAFVSAADVDLLVARFDEVAVRVAGGTLVPGEAAVLCGKEPCPGGTRTVTVDGSARRLRVLALAPQPGMAVAITGPGGSTTVDGAGPIDVGGATGTARAVAGRGLVVEIDRPGEDGSWTGPWTISLLDPTGAQEGQPATLNVYLFSDLGVGFSERPSFTRGEAVTVSAAPVLPKGVEADLVDATATVRMDDPIAGTTTRVELAGPPNGPYVGEVTIPASYLSNFTEASVELEGTTSAGARVTARSAPLEVLVLRPGNAVQFSPAELAFPSITGTGSSTALLALFGGEGGGCVWVGPARSDAPQGAGEIKVRYDGRAAVDEASCIEVPGGKPVYLEVQVSPSARASGTARGVLEIHEKGKGRDATVTEIPYRADLALGVDETRRLLLAVLLLLAGIALPLLLLYLVNVLTARFQSLDAVRGAVIPVKVDGSMLYRTDGGRLRPLTVTSEDFTSMAETGDARRFTFGGVEFRAKADRSPFGAPVAMAAPEGGAERLEGKAGSKVELETTLAGSWIFLLDPDRTRRVGPTEAVGNLLAFVSEGDATPQLARLVPELEEGLPTTAARLAALVRDKQSKQDRTEKAPTARDKRPGRTNRRGGKAEEADAGSDEQGAGEPGPEPPAISAEVDLATGDGGPDDTGPPVGFTGRGN